MQLRLYKDQGKARLQVFLLDVQGRSGQEDEVMERSRQFTAEGERHRVYKQGEEVWVDHVDKRGGKNDKINLTKNTGAKTVAQGSKDVKDYHSGKGPSYYRKGGKK